MITITKDKIFLSDFSLKKTKAGSESVEEISVDDIVYSLGEVVEIGEDVTFERLFDMVIFHKDLFNILFNAEMDGLTIDDFILDYEKEFELLHPFQKYKLMLSWDVAIYEVSDEIEYYDYPVFGAFGKIDTRIDGEEYPINVSFSSLSQFRKELLVLDNSFEIQNSNSHMNEIEASFKANYRPFTLHNLLGSILHEITQFGTPDERDQTLKEVQAKNEEINRWIEDGTIEENYSSSDLVDEMSELLEQDHDDDDNLTFWDTLYPSDKPIGKSSKELAEDKMIALSEDEDLPSLEEMLADAEDVEDYEKAAKIKKLIDKRDEKKKK